MNRIVFAALMGLTLAIGLTVASWPGGQLVRSTPPQFGDLPTRRLATPSMPGSTRCWPERDDALETVVAEGYVDHGGMRGWIARRRVVDELTLSVVVSRNSVVVNGVEAAPGTLVASIAPMDWREPGSPVCH